MAELHELIEKIENPELRAQIAEAAKRALRHKQFGLVFEEHLPECTPLYDIPVRKGAKVSMRNGKANETYTVLKIAEGKALCLPKNGTEAVEFDVAELVTTAELGDPIYPCLQPLGEVCNAPDSDLWHTLIEADNYHALQLLEYLYAGKVDCIYIDPPYNTRDKDWKYNNDYVDPNDSFVHSMWLSMMKKRLEIAKRLLNPLDSVLIVTIDEKEYLHLGCLLEELFPEAYIQMISSVISSHGSARDGHFSRTDEYIFYVFLGDAKICSSEDDMLNEGLSKTKSQLWFQFVRCGKGSKRADSKNLFYPIFIDPSTERIVSIGNPLPLEVERSTVVIPEGLIAIWPISSEGEEARWAAGTDVANRRLEKGLIRLARTTKNESGWSIMTVREGTEKRIEKEEVLITGHDEHGGAILLDVENSSLRVPKTVWNKASHNAGWYGSKIITKIIPKRNFDYPKSLYAVRDTIKFCVANKPSALIVDFFAGSGTTLHAVNLLNAEDGGNRRCIMVTNNELSDAEATSLKKQGFNPGDEEWSNLGIARHVTWPRTVCSITGNDVNGNPLNGKNDVYTSSITRSVQKKRSVKQISYFEDFLSLPLKDRKELIYLLTGKVIPKSLVLEDSKYVVSESPKHTISILLDTGYADEWISEIEELKHITDLYVVTPNKKIFNDLKKELLSRLDLITVFEEVTIPMADGFKANAAFFKLGFLDKTKVSLGMQFKELLSTLWMKAGAIGKCPVIDASVPDMLILPDNKMAILNDENQFGEFAEQLAQHPEIEVVYLVTDYESSFVSMTQALEGKTTYQLYKDYLDNFRINAGRNSR